MGAAVKSGLLSRIRDSLRELMAPGQPLAVWGVKYLTGPEFQEELAAGGERIPFTEMCSHRGETLVRGSFILVREDYWVIHFPGYQTMRVDLELLTLVNQRLVLGAFHRTDIFRIGSGRERFDFGFLGHFGYRAQNPNERLKWLLSEHRRKRGLP